jgi:hypothetical protein
MPFRVRIDPVALREIEAFAAYLGGYSEDLAIEQFERLTEFYRLPFVKRRSPGLLRADGSALSRLFVSCWAPNPILDRLQGR